MNSLGGAESGGRLRHVLRRLDNSGDAQRSGLPRFHRAQTSRVTPLIRLVSNDSRRYERLASASGLDIELRDVAAASCKRPRRDCVIG